MEVTMLSTVEVKKQQNIVKGRHFQAIYLDFSSTASNVIVNGQSSLTSLASQLRD